MRRARRVTLRLAEQQERSRAVVGGHEQDRGAVACSGDDLPRHYVASLPTRIFLCVRIRSGRKRTKPASRGKWQPTKSSGYRRGTSRFGRYKTGSVSNGSEGRSTAARRSSQTTMRATPHGHSRTCAYCRRMSRRCRSRPVIALRSASASIGTSTIGVGLTDSIRDRRPLDLLDRSRGRQCARRRRAPVP